jgi:LysM repeat protein
MTRLCRYVRKLRYACALACAAVSGAPAQAQTLDAIVHTVRTGETLKSIAELYYGERRDNVLAAENGLDPNASIVPGLRLAVPTVHYHRVQPGETWAELAERYYADVRRAFVLIEANTGSSSRTPEPGALLLVPFPLRYVSSAHDPIRQAARDFYDGSNKALAMLRRFNAIRAARSARGEVLLLPLSTLVLSDQGRRVADSQGQELGQAGQARDKQLSAQDALPKLRQHVLEGRYVEAVALANQLLGSGELTGNQLVTIQRELGTALIALDREDLAFEAFKSLLEQQPDVELGLGDTSPRVLKILDRARRALSDKHGAPQHRKGAATVSKTN